MPKMQVYLPDELYELVKVNADRLNVSGILQRALVEQLAELERLDALDRAVALFEADHRAFTAEELDARVAADRAMTRYPKAKRKRSAAA